MNGVPSLPDPGNSNLAFALIFLPKERRKDAMLFYRFCRAVDDIADDEKLEPAARERRLEEWRTTIEERRHDDLERLLEKHSIERSFLLEILSGCASDIPPRRFGTISAQTMVSEPMTNETPIREKLAALSWSQVNELVSR